MKNGHGYAWAIKGKGDWELCDWVEPDRQTLFEDGKPSPEARIVRVSIVPILRKKVKK